MSGLLRGVGLRLHGPLQAWGGASIGDGRPTLPFPTRSGVVGLLAACLGIERRETERLHVLADGLRVHVRIDAAGVVVVDDQTIQGNPNASPTRQTIQSKRSYLCDASFAVVVVPGAATTVAELARAVANPVFSPFLGRRSCVPSTPLLAVSEVNGPDPVALFDSIERGPIELLDALARRDGRRSATARSFDDFVLDLDEHPDALRRLRLRDDLRGPLARQFGERSALVVRVARPAMPMSPS